MKDTREHGRPARHEPEARPSRTTRTIRWPGRSPARRPRSGGRLAPDGLADRYPESAVPHEDGLAPDGPADQSPESVAPRPGRLGRVVLDRADQSAEPAAPRPDGPAIRRLALDGILDDFFFDPAYAHLIGASRDGFGQVVALDSGRRVADIDLPGLPHLGSGITWETGGRTVLATPNLKESAVSVIDMMTWRTVKRIHTLGPGFFMRSHERSRDAWVDVFFGPHRDAVHVIDKSSLEIVETGAGLKLSTPSALGSVYAGAQHVVWLHVRPFGDTLLTKCHVDAWNFL